ncbi:hypothetical protein BCH308197_B0054 (plasmid) [Bacillus cereus H3081.97]|nr:hypothetical protein BCH308197_B0054 [Bacillus cereus H3081.97]
MNFFFALIGYFILSTLLLLLFYVYSKQTDKKTRYLKALLSSLLGLIASIILIVVYKFNQDTINFTYGKIKDNYLDGLQGDIFSYNFNDNTLLIIISIITFIFFFYVGRKSSK